ISPTDLDSGSGDANAKRWLKTGKCIFLPEERECFARLESWGLTDTYRSLNSEKSDSYSWFDYRSKGFDDSPKRGLRIDVIMASSATLPHLKDAEVDYELRAMEKPSDH
ncbi:exodeoxyribonuclease III, partial [Marinomonas agarivorans]